MTLSPKKKKSNIRREVRIGGCTLLLMSPVILFAFAMSVFAIINGLQYMQIGGFQYRYGVEMVIVFSIITAIYVGVGYLSIRRLRELYQQGQYLDSEETRVADMMNMQIAKDHLMDQPNSAARMTSDQDASLRHPKNIASEKE